MSVNYSKYCTFEVVENVATQRAVEFDVVCGKKIKKSFSLFLLFLFIYFSFWPNVEELYRK